MSVLEGIMRNVLKWFEHMEILEKERLVKRCIGQLWNVIGGEGDCSEDGGIK